MAPRKSTTRSRKTPSRKTPSRKTPSRKTKTPSMSMHELCDRQIINIKNQAENTIRELVQNHNNRVNYLDDEIKRLRMLPKQDCKDVISDMQRQLSSEKALLSKQHEDAIRSINDTHRRQVESLKKEFSACSDIKEELRQKQNELVDVRKALEQAKASGESVDELKKINNQLQAEVTELKEQIQADWISYEKMTFESQTKKALESATKELAELRSNELKLKDSCEMEKIRLETAFKKELESLKNEINALKTMKKEISSSPPDRSSLLEQIRAGTELKKTQTPETSKPAPSPLASIMHDRREVISPTKDEDDDEDDDEDWKFGKRRSSKKSTKRSSKKSAKRSSKKSTKRSSKKSTKRSSKKSAKRSSKKSAKRSSKKSAKR